MTGRAMALVAACSAALVLLSAGLATVAMPTAGGPACAPGPGMSASVAAGPYAPIGEWDGGQVGNAAVIIRVGQQLSVPPRGWVIAVATAMQESSLVNRPDGDRDSLGLFQQRPSQGWGTREQIMDPEYSSRAFYNHLVEVDRWQQMPLADAAQAVQGSADGSLYADDEKPARRLVAALTGLQASGLAGCAPASVDLLGWTQPVRGPITSGYGPRGEDEFHAGTDIGVPKGTKVHAAAGGKVSTVMCHAHRGGVPYSCDIDGSPQVEGCGWYLEITHPGGILTRYCHLLTRPHVTVGQQVSAGQVIAVSGNSGNTSGPHLHYEVRVRGAAIDPEPWHRAHGAPLGP